MTDQQLLLAAVRELGLIVAERFEGDGRNAAETISRLIAVLDNEELARAVERLEKGHGLRVVKLGRRHLAQVRAFIHDGRRIGP